MEVTIDYYQSRGLESDELEVIQAVTRDIETDSLRLVPNDKDLFRVSVNGEVVFESEDKISTEEVLEKIEGYEE